MKKFLTIAFVFFQITSHGQPSGIHLSWNGNGKVHPESTMSVTWMNVEKGDVLIYGTDSNKLKSKGAPSIEYSSNLNTHVYKLTLSKLKPAQRYYYQIRSANNLRSRMYSFCTAPRPGSKALFSVGVWSDTQNNGTNLNFEHTDSIVAQLQQKTFNFTLHNGDIVENGSVVKSWKGFFNTAQPVNAEDPFMSVTGNHDVINADTSSQFQKPFPVFYELFNLPGNQLNYSYDYGNTHFIAINSGYAQGAEKKNRVLFEPASEEYRWLEADLHTARKNKNTTWIVLYCHYPLYSWGVSHIPTWEDHIKPLVDKYQVDLCLAGHRHVYERHKAIRGAVVFDMTTPNHYERPQGTVYVTNGSCGGSLQGIGGSELKTMVFTPAEKLYTYAVMTIEERQLSYQVFDIMGKSVDSFTISK